MFGMDRRTDGHFQSTSGHFQSTSGSLPVHLGTIGGHMRHHSYSLPKKMNFPKFADIRMEKKSQIAATEFNRLFRHGGHLPFLPLDGAWL